MPDREKVIKALDGFLKNRICLPHLVPWDEIADAIELLKEQEKILELQHSAMRGSSDMIELLFQKLDGIVLCKDCKRRGTYNCPVYVGGDGMCSEPDDWFCADGKRK